MRKFKFFINYDKEEKWLNDMAKKGYELETASFGYKFSFTKPENTKIRIDYRIFKNKGGFMDYSALFEDSGWKHISGNKSCGAQYFKKINENGDEDIFSDDMSKAARYKRLSDMWIGLAVVYLPISIALALNQFLILNYYIIHQGYGKCLEYHFGDVFYLKRLLQREEVYCG
ncbi:DUF2812 domain-containing protein [Clostridium algidicarnis]|uniref:DUF2812 domain-containing protein n=1 Tax=Clostridium algidicarnis TaxID=37659 RepID=UPI000A439C2C|nr:DUF2812 domain-containing protein [Clostridium algidicarnis]